MDAPAPVTLETFLKNTAKRVYDGQDIPVESFLAEAETYDILRSYLLEHPELPAKLLVADGQEARNILREFFARPEQFLDPTQLPEEARGLKQFIAYREGLGQTLPTGKSSPVRTEALSRTKESLIRANQQEAERQATQARTFVHEFFNRYQKQKFSVRREEVEEVVKKVIAKPVYASTPKETAKELARRISADPVFSQDIHAAQTIAEETLESTRFNEVRHATDGKQAAAVRAVITHPEIIATPVVIETLVRSPAVNQQEINHAMQLGRMATAVGSTSMPETKNIHPSHIASGPLSAVADVALSVFPKAQQEAIIETFTKAWEQTTKSEGFVGEMTRRLGEDAFNSEIFQKMLRSGEDVITQRHGAQAFVQGIGKFAGNIIDATRGPNEDMYLYLQAMYERAKNVGVQPTVNPHEFYVARAFVHSPHAFHASPLEWLLEFGAKKEAAAVATGAAGTAAKTTLKGWSREAIKDLGVKFLTRIHLAGLAELLGGPVGWVIFGLTVVAPMIWGRVTKLLGALSLRGLGVGAASGGIEETVRGLLNSTATYQDPFAKNYFLLGSLLLATVPALLVVFIMVPMAKNVQIAALLPVGVTAPTIDCAKTPAAPECKLTRCEGECRWPLDISTHACIITGPFVNTHAKSHLSAIDFITIPNQGDLFGKPVYTPYAGRVARAIFGYTDGTYSSANSGYGNQVFIELDDGGGYLIFAHLRNIQTVQKDQVVSAGTVVGYVDHTGVSGGAHLHYEHRAFLDFTLGADINKFLPFPVPPCIGRVDCDAKIKAVTPGASACL